MYDEEFVDHKLDFISLKALGFTATELCTAGFTIAELKKLGVTAVDINRYRPLTGYTERKNRLKELKDAGYTLIELSLEISEGVKQFSLMEMLEAGFDHKELSSNRYSIKDFLTLEPINLLKFKIPIQFLRDIGFTPKDVLDKGYGPSEVMPLGYSIQDFKDSGVDVVTTADCLGKEIVLESNLYTKEEKDLIKLDLGPISEAKQEEMRRSIAENAIARGKLRERLTKRDPSPSPTPDRGIESPGRTLFSGPITSPLNGRYEEADPEPKPDKSTEGNPTKDRRRFSIGTFGRSPTEIKRQTTVSLARPYSKGPQVRPPSEQRGPSLRPGTTTETKSPLLLPSRSQSRTPSESFASDSVKGVRQGTPIRRSSKLQVTAPPRTNSRFLRMGTGGALSNPKNSTQDNLKLFKRRFGRARTRKNSKKK
jgi:hypothetical protein